MRKTPLRSFRHGCLILVSALLAYVPAGAQIIGGDTLPTDDVRIRVSPYHTAPADMATGAVSSIAGSQLDGLPGINRTNLLNGRVTGFLGIQNNGTLGSEDNAIYIRGLRSLGSTRQAVLLVDGYVRQDAKNINPYDIASITILKDASATAMFGLRGANGLVLITTKRGAEGMARVSYDNNLGWQSPTRLPAYLGSYDYARLYNEASVNDGGLPKYDDYDLEGYRTGEDPYAYPDVNWMDEFMKKNSFVQRHNVSVRGGSERVGYYASVGYIYNTGLYNVDQSANTYKTNADYQGYTLRGNVDVMLSDNLLVSMDLNAQMTDRHAPGAWSNNTSRVLNSLTQTPPNAYSIFNPDGSLGGTAQYLNNPYGLLNESGYSLFKTRTSNATLRFEHKLDFITKGLSLFGALSFDTYYEQVINRNVGFYVYEGSLDEQRGTKDPATMTNTNAFQSNYRAFDLQAGVDYARAFNWGNVTGKVFWNQNTESGDGRIMPHIYKGTIGYLHYDYKNRYLADFTFAYQGSEQISGNGYNFFPAGSVGWVLSEEPFMKGGISKVISFAKLRASYGVSGNDGNIGYFQKVSFFSTIGSGYIYGEGLQTMQGFRESQIGVNDIIAERSKKANVGLDVRLLKNRWSLSLDAFHEDNTGLITQRNDILEIMGFRSAINSNVGRIVNRGFEISTDYTNNSGKLGYSVFANFTYARNIVKDMQETGAVYRFNRHTGLPLNSFFGLKSAGLFYDQADINSHATQMYGTYNPGDIKYLDLSHDGTINEDDRTYLGFGTVPEYVYGLGGEVRWKGFDLNIFFQGVGNVQTKLGGYVYWEFRPDGLGNVMKHHLDRWAYDPGAGIDTRESATYPRLSLTGNDGNNRGPESDYWLRNAWYLRLKSAELGYTLPQKAAKAIWLKNLRVYVSGVNLLTFDDIGILDPESTTTGVVYPLQRVISAGINITF